MGLWMRTRKKLRDASSEFSTTEVKNTKEKAGWKETCLVLGDAGFIVIGYSRPQLTRLTVQSGGKSRTAVGWEAQAYRPGDWTRSRWDFPGKEGLLWRSGTRKMPLKRAKELEGETGCVRSWHSNADVILQGGGSGQHQYESELSGDLNVRGTH